MSRARADDIFNRAFPHGPNFMTPEILDRGMAGTGLAWELSTGEFMGHTRYGVTVIQDGVRQGSRHDLSAPFDTLAEAEEYIKTLGGRE